MLQLLIRRRPQRCINQDPDECQLRRPEQSMFCLSLADFYSSHCPPQLHEIKKSSRSDGRRAPFLFNEFLLTWFYVPKWVRALIVQSAGINCCCSVSQKEQKKSITNEKVNFSYEEGAKKCLRWILVILDNSQKTQTPAFVFDSNRSYTYWLTKLSMSTQFWWI